MELFPAIRYIFFLQKKDTATIGARANTFDTSLARIAAKILLQIVMKRSAMAFCKRLQRIAGIAPNKKATQILRGFYYKSQYSSYVFCFFLRAAGNNTLFKISR